ncbi:MAG: hypothetical protein ACK5KO_11905 [Arachnia sp.]
MAATRTELPSGWIPITLGLELTLGHHCGAYTGAKGHGHFLKREESQYLI